MARVGAAFSELVKLECGCALSHSHLRRREEIQLPCVPVSTWCCRYLYFSHTWGRGGAARCSFDVHVSMANSVELLFVLLLSLTCLLCWVPAQLFAHLYTGFCLTVQFCYFAVYSG